MNLNWILLGFMLLLSIFKIDTASNKLTSCDETKNTKILGSCCNVPRNDQYSKACRQSLLSQSNHTTNNAETRNLKSDKVALHACMAECVFKKNGFLYLNGTVNIAVMQRNFEQRYKKDATLSKLVVKSLNRCVEYAKDRTKQFEWLHVKDNCDYYPATLLACIMEQVYQNCPASLWKNTEDCVAMKKFLIACDDVRNRK